MKTKIAECTGCGKPMNLFAGYIPKKGEFCKVCYDKQLVESSSER